ncbi:immunity 52 family protein [Streptomyces sp. JH14]|uniref:Imm52 family immunity protein n=1 Tax=Streptomyces sp. JH14 TaxID=2793630 RepID=UPI0023F85C12|nr:Imm52 family immunity protein [Streptomyces sp. JH14]MDF6041712.1 immunity 52 family protein [Streptomyces sp. JH14]
MRRVVRGFWGPREESVEAVAGRWKLMLDRLAGLLPAPGAGGTWSQVRESGPATGLGTDEASLLAALKVQQQEARYGSDGAGLYLVTKDGQGWEIEARGLAGGASEFLFNSMVIGIKSPEGVDVPDAELLRAVAEVWGPDFGDVTDDDVLDALGDNGFGVGAPAVGWVGYLSPGRAALLPDGLTSALKELAGGGVLLDIAPRGDAGAVVRACVQLRDAGALEPLPRPMDRPAL